MGQELLKCLEILPVFQTSMLMFFVSFVSGHVHELTPGARIGCDLWCGRARF